MGEIKINYPEYKLRTDALKKGKAGLESGCVQIESGETETKCMDQFLSVWQDLNWLIGEYRMMLTGTEMNLEKIRKEKKQQDQEMAKMWKK